MRALKAIGKKAILKIQMGAQRILASLKEYQNGAG